MRIIKKFFFPCLASLTYLLLLGAVFFGSSLSEIGTTIGLQIILFIFLHFTLLPLNKSTLLKLSKIFTLRGIFLTLFALIFLNIQQSVFLLLTHITIGLYTLMRYYRLASTKRRYYRSTANQGISTISIMLAITYTTTLWVAGATVNLNCDTLREQSVGFLTKFIPSLDSDGKFMKRIGNIDQFGSQSLGELLGTSSNHNPEQSISGLNLTGEIVHTGLLSSLLSYQESIVNGLINNQNLINAQVCDLTLSHITSLAKSSDVQFISFVLLTLLLYVFMSTLGIVIGIINYLILLLLVRTGFITFTSTKEKVQHIKL